MSFAVTGLPVESFKRLFGLGDDALRERGVIRQTAVAGERFPCRITLKDAPAGDTLLLLNFQHHDVASPYRSNYAIYVNEAATETTRLVDDLPPVLRGRPIALRGFDAGGLLLDAELALADDVEAVIRRQFAIQEVAYLHAHNARAGCFAARIDRA
jgi:hypothetical protein